MNQELIFLTFGTVGAFFTYLIFTVSKFLREEQIETKNGSGAIECGFEAIGEARGIGFKYFNYAMLFLVFEIAGLFLFLFSVNSQKSFSLLASLSVLIITLLLTIYFATKKEDLYAT